VSYRMFLFFLLSLDPLGQLLNHQRGSSERFILDPPFPDCPRSLLPLAPPHFTGDFVFSPTPLRRHPDPTCFLNPFLHLHCKYVPFPALRERRCFRILLFLVSPQEGLGQTDLASIVRKCPFEDPRILFFFLPTQSLFLRFSFDPLPPLLICFFPSPQKANTNPH